MTPNSFYIETYGCTSNKADSLIISQILRDNGYYAETIEKAEFIIVNTCGVKQQTENKIKTRLKTLSEQYKNDRSKHFIIAGCLPYIASNYLTIIKNLVPNFSAIIDLNNFEHLPSLFKRISQGEKNIILKAEKRIDKAEFLINHEEGKITGIVPISEGCSGSCTYCCVKNARGRLNCYDPNKIKKNSEFQLRQGIKQLYLTSQDCSVYRYDSTQLSDLVHNITHLPFDFFLRIGMLNPRFLIDHFRQLELIYNQNKVYQFLHVPIQSGSDKILNLMKRPYKIAAVKLKLEDLRREFPNLTISTDIITGFPEETEDDFQNTLDLIDWLKPEILNISKFTLRPGTKAKTMKQIDSKIIKHRSIQLSKLYRSYLKNLNSSWVGWEGPVLTLHRGSEHNQVFGRNFAYKNVFIDNASGNYGEFVEVKVIKIDGFNLFAKILNINNHKA